LPPTYHIPLGTSELSIFVIASFRDSPPNSASLATVNDPFAFTVITNFDTAAGELSK
jgi:hypothetical protein